MISNGARVVSGPAGQRVDVVGQNPSSSNNSVVVTGAGTVWDETVNSLTLGYFGTGNTLVINNGGQVFASKTVVGQESLSAGNSILVSGIGSVWSNSQPVYVGSSGTGNSLVISNGGRVFSGPTAAALISGFVGFNSGSSSNTVLVSDPNSAWNNAADFFMGYSGNGNSLVISNGGQVANRFGYVGGSAGSSSNSVLVTGVGSVWSNSGTLSISPQKGQGNSLTINNGGKVISTYGFLISPSNSVLVSGTGSVWSNRNDLSVGGYGAGNSLVITNGGQVVVNGTGIVGGGNGGSDRVRVVSGGIWQNSALIVGNQGTSNSLVIADGLVFATNLVVGAASATCDNFVQLDSGSLTVTNAIGDAVLELRHGQFILNGGTLQVDTLVMTNACGLFVPHGGTLHYNQLVLDPNLSALGDGIPNGWKQQYGFDPLDPTVANADPDGDGFSNLQEYLAGTDPTNSASSFQIISVLRTNNDLLISWMTGIGRTNALQVGTGSGGGYATNFTDIFAVTNTTGTVTNYLDVGAATNFPARYYRVRLVP